MLLSEEEWMDLRAYRSLRAAGATWADIAREAGCDWGTARSTWRTRPRPDAPFSKDHVAYQAGATAMDSVAETAPPLFETFTVNG